MISPSAHVQVAAGSRSLHLHFDLKSILGIALIVCGFVFAQGPHFLTLLPAGDQKLGGDIIAVFGTIGTLLSDFQAFVQKEPPAPAGATTN